MEGRYLEGYMKNMEYDKYQLKFSNVLEEDLSEIYNYIAQILKEPIIAKRLVNKIEEEIYRLEMSLYLGQKVHVKPRNEEYRRLVIGNYIVLYRIEDTQKEILIFHIFYGKRNYLANNN